MKKHLKRRDEAARNAISSETVSKTYAFHHIKLDHLAQAGLPVMSTFMDELVLMHDLLDGELAQVVIIDLGPMRSSKSLLRNVASFVAGLNGTPAVIYYTDTANGRFSRDHAADQADQADPDDAVDDDETQIAADMEMESESPRVADSAATALPVPALDGNCSKRRRTLSLEEGQIAGVRRDIDAQIGCSNLAFRVPFLQC